MTPLYKCRNHFFWHIKSSSVVYVGSPHYYDFKNKNRIIVNIIDGGLLHSMHEYTLLKRVKEYIQKQISFLENGFFVRLLNSFDDATSCFNEQTRSKSKTSKSVFNDSNFVSLWQTLVQNNDRTGLFSAGHRVEHSRKYSTVMHNSKRELSTIKDDMNRSEKMYDRKEVNQYSTRSHTCGELRISDLGKEVKLCGWIQFIRMDKFILLRDSYGTTQILINELVDCSVDFDSLHIESVICVAGTVVARPKSQINTELSTGEIEILASSVQVLNKSMSKMPFLIRDYNKANSKVLNRYRFLALRFPELQNNLRLRSEMMFQMRNFLITRRKFVEVETPTLFKKTPGGAQEFIVPTEHKNRFYSLVQSPQQLKQLLMVGSIDRYFQIARCYRDEKSNPERQPEFTQLDIELSFTTMESVMKLTEDILVACWPQDKPSISAPFPKMTYKDAVEKYGSDKPCLLNELLIHNLGTCIQRPSEKSVYMFTIPEAQSSYKQIKQRIGELKHLEATKVYVIKTPSTEKMLQDLKKILPNFDTEVFKNSFSVNEGDVVVLSTGSNEEDTLKTLGSCRHETIDQLNLLQKSNNEKVYEFTWIVDFPLLEKNELGEIKSTHHPFTHPHPQDVHLIPNEAIKARSLAYDLVLNGSEVGGGSIRIHDAELQRTIFKLLNLEEKDFRHLLEALEMGCPPHGGIALGLDRLFAIICNSKSIKDVIAFPKGWEGQDLMTGCPSDVPNADKKRYHVCSGD